MKLIMKLKVEVPDGPTGVEFANKLEATIKSNYPDEQIAFEAVIKLDKAPQVPV